MMSCSNFTKTRALVTFQSRYTTTVAALDGAIKVGRMALRLSTRLHLPITYGCYSARCAFPVIRNS